MEALAELRRQATSEDHCAQHVQAITIAIDQYAEKALGNRDYFLNKPYGAGWLRVCTSCAMKNVMPKEQGNILI